MVARFFSDGNAIRYVDSVMFPYNGGNRPEWTTMCMFCPVSQVVELGSKSAVPDCILLFVQCVPLPRVICWQRGLGWQTAHPLWILHMSFACTCMVLMLVVNRWWMKPVCVVQCFYTWVYDRNCVWSVKISMSLVLSELLSGQVEEYNVWVTVQPRKTAAGGG